MRISLSVLLVGAAWGLTPLVALAQTPVSTSMRISGSCSNCNLSNRTMPGMRLEGSNFSGSDFSGSNLSGSTFNRSNLAGASFHKSYLLRIKGDNVIFKHTTLRNSTLTEANITRSNLTFADLRRSDLTNSTFSNCDFSNALLMGSDAASANFSGSIFKSARFDHSNLVETDFSNADFSDARFGHAILTEASFDGANFSSADLSNVTGLVQEQLGNACGDENTQLPTGLTLSQCAAVEPSLPIQKAGIETQSSDERLNNFLRHITQKASKFPTQTNTTVILGTTISTDNLEAPKSEMDMAIQEIDRAIRDLPLGSPTRKRLLKSRQHMENARANGH